MSAVLDFIRSTEYQRLLERANVYWQLRENGVAARLAQEALSVRSDLQPILDSARQLQRIQRATEVLQPYTPSVPDWFPPPRERPATERTLRELAQEVRGLGRARRYLEALRAEVEEFERQLRPDQELAVVVMGAGREYEIRPTGVAYREPCFVCFVGVRPDGTLVRLIENINQLSYRFEVRSRDATRPRRQIGFITDDERHR
ncbi:MAG: hypothetical protein ACRETY_08410 [Steroidobacteraceae bacterium]